MTDSKHETENTGVRERLAQFEEAVARVRSGEYTAEAFSEWLENASDQQAARAESVQQIYLTLPPELEDAFRQETEVGYQGIGFYRVGIEHMREFVRTSDDARLDAGLTAIRQGNACINLAMRLNRDNRDSDDEG